MQIKEGWFKAADKGTLFLDEIGETSLNMQVKLPRVLENGLICPVGSTTEIKVDVKVIAATNRNLEEMIDEGKFREDLFQRLDCHTIYLPELSERTSDLPLLIDHFIDRMNKKHALEKKSARTQSLYWKGVVGRAGMFESCLISLNSFGYFAEKM